MTETALSPKIPLSAIRCRSYEPATVETAVKKLLEPLGGLGRFVKPGMSVFLKPNLLSSRDPKECVTTHPAVVEAVAKLCIELGAAVFIGDSPPIAFGKIEHYWAKTGMKAAAERVGATLICLEKGPRREIKVHTLEGWERIHITEWFFQADCVINLPKLKTHNLTVITGAVKNHYGLLPGAQKAQFHVKYPKPRAFSGLIADIYKAVPMHLSIMDGIEGMDETGPAGGRVIKPGVLLASPSAVAVDLAFAELVGLSPDTIPYLEYCRRLEIRPESLSEVECLGEELETLKIRDFRAPPSKLVWKLMPDSMIRIAQKLIWLRPVIIQKKCIKCGVCRKVCPAGAIAKKGDSLEIVPRRCISCFCCTEVCPENAITPASSPLVSLALAVRRVKHFLQGRSE